VTCNKNEEGNDSLKHNPNNQHRVQSVKKRDISSFKLKKPQLNPKTPSITDIKKTVIFTKKKPEWPKPSKKVGGGKQITGNSVLYKMIKTYPEEHVRKDFLYLKSKVLSKRVPVHVVLPESYEKYPERYYPFVIFLGGNHYIKGGPFSSVRYWDWIFNIARRYSNILSGNLRREITSIFKGKYLDYWLNKLNKYLQPR